MLHFKCSIFRTFYRVYIYFILLLTYLFLLLFTIPCNNRRSIRYITCIRAPIFQNMSFLLIFNIEQRLNRRILIIAINMIPPAICHLPFAQHLPFISFYFEIISVGNWIVPICFKIGSLCI